MRAHRAFAVPVFHRASWRGAMKAMQLVVLGLAAGSQQLSAHPLRQGEEQTQGQSVVVPAANRSSCLKLSFPIIATMGSPPLPPPVPVCFPCPRVPPHPPPRAGGIRSRFMLKGEFYVRN